MIEILPPGIQQAPVSFSDQVLFTNDQDLAATFRRLALEDEFRLCADFPEFDLAVNALAGDCVRPEAETPLSQLAEVLWADPVQLELDLTSEMATLLNRLHRAQRT